MNILASPYISIGLDLAGEPGKAVVIRRSDQDLASLCLAVLGVVQAGHRETVVSGFDEALGRVAVDSNHTHHEHRLRKPRAERAAVEWNLIDAGTVSLFVGRFVPGIPDGTHKFDAPGQTFIRAAKRDDAGGVAWMTIGPDVPPAEGTTRIGRGLTFLEFSDQHATLYVNGSPRSLGGTLAARSGLAKSIDVKTSATRDE